MSGYLAKSPIRKNGFIPLRRSPLRNGYNANTLEKSISEPAKKSNDEDFSTNLVNNKAKSYPKNYKVVYEIFSWEMDQRRQKFKGKTYSFDTCWECDQILKLSKKKKKPLALRCQCPGVKLFCSRYCRYSHWLTAQIKMCSKTNKDNINKELTRRDIKDFNKVTKYLKSINSLESIDF